MVNIVAFLVTKHNATSHTTHGENAFWVTRGAEYAAKLFAGVDRHVTQPHVNFLITDTPSATPKNAEYIPHPMDRRQAPGWWSKLAVFKPYLLPLNRTLYLDLDNVVCGPLDPMLNLVPSPIVMMHDLVYPDLENGSTLLFHPAELSYLWNEYAQNPTRIQREFSQWPKASDQAFIANRVKKATGKPIPFFQSLLPHGFCLNSRIELELGRRSYADTSLVYGCWVPKPHESTHPFYKEHWRV